MVGFTLYMKDLLVSNNKYLGYYSLSSITELWTSAYGNYCKQFGGIIDCKGTMGTRPSFPTLEANFHKHNSKPNLRFTLFNKNMPNIKLRLTPASVSISINYN
jgi:hypothetical protein